MTQVRKTATYRVVTDSGGDRIFRFYCDFSGELCCVSKPIRADTEEAALEIAWEQEGKWEFNLCPKCGKYVSSAMFNVNAGLCLDCAPWEDEYPSFCHHCGARLRESDTCFCPICGAKLQVGGTDGKEPSVVISGKSRIRKVIKIPNPKMAQIKPCETIELIIVSPFDSSSLIVT